MESKVQVIEGPKTQNIIHDASEVHIGKNRQRIEPKPHGTGSEATKAGRSLRHQHLIGEDP